MEEPAGGAAGGDVGPELTPPIPGPWIAGGAALGGAVLSCAAWSLLEAGRLQVEYLSFELGAQGPVLKRFGPPSGATDLGAAAGPAVPPPASPSTLRLAHLSDLHLHRREGKAHREALRWVGETGAHLAVVTGDVMDRWSRPGAERPYLLQLARQVQLAVVWGNHDHERPQALARLSEALRAAGAWVLVNRRVLLHSSAGPVQLVGVDTPDLGYDRYEQAVGEPPLLEARWDPGAGAWRVIGGRQGGGPAEPGDTGSPVAWRVVAAHTYHLLDHHPGALEGCLVLVGDTHGGQIDLPWLGPVWARWVHRHRFVKGLFRVGGAWLYVNRGVGTVGLPVRLRCRPEVTIIDLSSPRGPS